MWLYAIFLVVLGCGAIWIFLVSAGLAVFSFFTKSIPFRWISCLGLIAYTLVALSIADRFISEPEWNPDIKADHEVVGVWGDWHHTLQLKSDHHYTYEHDGTVTKGVWNRDDWNLYLKTDASVPNGSAITFRFIEYKGRLRVLTHELGDPDGWDGDTGLSKKA
jgi:hypothetical protein